MLTKLLDIIANLLAIVTLSVWLWAFVVYGIPLLKSLCH